jgi:hypothetical protein
MGRLGSCEFEEVADELDLAAFDCSDRFEPAQGCFG